MGCVACCGCVPVECGLWIRAKVMLGNAHAYLCVAVACTTPTPHAYFAAAFADATGLKDDHKSKIDAFWGGHP